MRRRSSAGMLAMRLTPKSSPLGHKLLITFLLALSSFGICLLLALMLRVPLGELFTKYGAVGGSSAEDRLASQKTFIRSLVMCTIGLLGYQVSLVAVQIVGSTLGRIHIRSPFEGEGEDQQAAGEGQPLQKQNTKTRLVYIKNASLNAVYYIVFVKKYVAVGLTAGLCYLLLPLIFVDTPHVRELVKSPFEHGLEAIALYQKILEKVLLAFLELGVLIWLQKLLIANIRGAFEKGCRRRLLDVKRRVASIERMYRGVMYGQQRAIPDELTRGEASSVGGGQQQVRLPPGQERGEVVQVKERLRRVSGLPSPTPSSSGGSGGQRRPFARHRGSIAGIQSQPTSTASDGQQQQQPREEPLTPQRIARAIFDHVNAISRRPHGPGPVKTIKAADLNTFFPPWRRKRFSMPCARGTRVSPSPTGSSRSRRSTASARPCRRPLATGGPSFGSLTAC